PNRSAPRRSAALSCANSIALAARLAACRLAATSAETRSARKRAVATWAARVRSSSARRDTLKAIHPAPTSGSTATGTMMRSARVPMRIASTVPAGGRGARKLSFPGGPLSLRGMPEVVGEGMRALVVDDEEVVRSVVLEVLEGMGFAARPAESLADARRKLIGEAWDLLIIDKNLPDGSGLTLVREVGEGSLDAQIVVMSGYATLSSAVEALQAGVADYVVKPFDLADFRARLQRAVEALKLRRANRRLLGELKEKNTLLEGLATRDPLTGLDNHASFQESIRREIARAHRHRLSCSLLLGSIDRFRDINAQLGFGGGDSLLRALGDFLLHSGRASDVPAYLGSTGVLARFGGDTFAVLLPETDRTGGAT